MALLTSKATELRDVFLQLGIERRKAVRIINGGGSLQHEFDVDAEVFLQQAEDDFELGGNSALLNAVSNAKRAIHAQIDEVLASLGYKTKHRAFDKKLALFTDLGFVAPRVLRRINDARNILEHEYVMPTLNQVQEAIDLATLFVSATRRHSQLWEDEFAIGNRDQQIDDTSFCRQVVAGFQEETPVFCLTDLKDVLPFEEWSTLEPQPQYGVTVAEITISAGEPLFEDLVRLVVAGDREKKMRQALNQLFDRLQL